MSKKPKFIIERPGRLVSDVQLYLNTVDSQTVFMGLQSQEAVGLLTFGGRMSEIWDAASRDDPYADYYLLKVYDAIIKLRNELAALIQDYDAKLKENLRDSHISCDAFASEKPLIKPLWFRTQYGYLGAQLIADFDKFTRLVLTANWIGILLDDNPQALRKRIIDKITKIFQLPMRWQDFELIRRDIKNKSEKSIQAQEILGKLPDAILDKTLRAPFAPNIKPPGKEKKTTEPPTSSPQAT